MDRPPSDLANTPATKRFIGSAVPTLSTGDETLSKSPVAPMLPTKLTTSARTASAGAPWWAAIWPTEALPSKRFQMRVELGAAAPAARASGVRSDTSIEDAKRVAGRCFGVAGRAHWWG